LVGLEQTPELYRCGISYAGVTDIIRTLKKSLPDLKLAQAIAIEQIGDVKEDKAHLKDVSPLSHVDKIQVPVFLAHGENDDRVPIDTVRDLAKALKKQGKLYDFMERAEEGHGFHQEANRIAFWTKVDAFLRENLKN
jgi:dipeptidyl aminopeptidase/acylaminoacyl peptidase